MRKTTLVQQTLNTLSRSETPMTAPSILESLNQQGFSPNKTTLYRIIERLKSRGEINEVLLHAGVSYFEIKGHHHHHFSCNQCNQVSCISDDILEKRIHTLKGELSNGGYDVDEHQFAFFGTCPDCKKN